MFRRLAITFVLPLGAALTVFAVAALPLVEEPAERARLMVLLATVATLGVAAVTALSAHVARRTTRPLRDLTRAAERIAAGTEGDRVYTDGRDEVGVLSGAFNRMAERLASRIAALEDDRQQLRAILGGMVEGVVALDAEQRVLFANVRAAELLDFPTAAPVGRRLWELVRRRPLLDLVQKALQQAEPHREELRWDEPAARSLAVHVARLPGPAARGAVVVLHDTTDLRRLERLRQDFVANVSHELKTPLTGIKLCVETLLAGAVDDPEHRGRFLEQIAAQSERLHALILDLLSLARIESGEALLEFDAVPVEAAVSACVERCRPRAEARRQTLEVVVDGELAAAVWADQEAVEHILDNLLDNAVKYTPESGHIRVGWRDDGDVVRLEVADDGLGIPEADLPRLFERFYRVDKARSRQLGGTGLGLAIVKHLAQAMGGGVQAVSRVGHGSSFTVRLPRAPSLRGAPAAPPVPFPAP
jgi:two-component system phosphate regulon sensor histidine kinase PhoR